MLWGHDRPLRAAEDAFLKETEMTTNAALLIQQPDGSTQEVALEAVSIILGRAKDCDIVVAGQLISRRHACIRRAEHCYTLEDLGSHNGTTINGQRLNGTRTLHDGDCIELGGMRRLFFVDGDATSTRPQPPSTGLWLDEATQDVWVDGQCLHPQLSTAQFCLLKLLVARAGCICTRAEIVTAVWPGATDGVSEDAVDGLVKRVRARLSEVSHGDHYLQNVRGRGLILRSAGESR
jgi:DNA-binding response OmpR family regulator